MTLNQVVYSYVYVFLADNYKINFTVRYHIGYFYVFQYFGILTFQIFRF